MRFALILMLSLLALAGCGGEETESAYPGAEAAERALAGSPPELAQLHEQGNELLEGGPDAFKERLTELRGRPVVVNKWASWCPPCRAEFPYFQRQAIAKGKEVAFLGVNTDDSESGAAKFLQRFPVPFPHYKDPDGEVARVFNGGATFPVTAFYDAKGNLTHTKQGGYATEADLAADIERYAR